MIEPNERVENCSVEVHREGPLVWLSIRSEEREGRAVGLTLADAGDVARLLHRAVAAYRRPIRDLDQA